MVALVCPLQSGDDKDCVLDCPSRTNCVAQTCCGPRGKDGGPEGPPAVTADGAGTLRQRPPTEQLSTPA